MQTWIVLTLKEWEVFKGHAAASEHHGGNIEHDITSYFCRIDCIDANIKTTDTPDTVLVAD